MLWRLFLSHGESFLKYKAIKKYPIVDDALLQIEERDYAKPYQADSRTVIKTGVNISSKTRTVGDWKSVLE